MKNHSKILKLPFELTKFKIQCFTTSNIICNTKNVSSSVAKYPPIVDYVVNTRDRRKQKLVEWHSKITKLPTVEQKLIELNMPKYYGFGCYVLNDFSLGNSCLDFLKFITRTNVYKNLPAHYYSDISSLVDGAVKRVKGPVEELIHLHNVCGKKRGYIFELAPQWRKDTETQNTFLINLHNIFLKHLRNDIPHLSVDSIDLDPRIEGFWFVGGFEPREIVKRMRAGRPKSKPFKDDPIDRTFRSSVRPAFALRSNLGLRDVIPFDGSFSNSITDIQPAENVQDGLPSTISEHTKEQEQNDYSSENFNPLGFSVYDTDPKTWDIRGFRVKRATIIPGFWPGVESEHGHIFFHSRAAIEKRLKQLPQDYQAEYYPVYLEQQAINAGFTQALSYGFYQGFTPVDEMTYPIVQQGVSTDGKNFQFSLYQLNTSCLHSNNATDSPRINYLWLSEDMPLYESVEDGIVKGLNEDVLKILCSMYLKKGSERENPNPYLAHYKYLMHHDAPDEYKEEFQDFLRGLVLSERKRIIREGEMLPWEWIYKFRFKTRPMDPKFKYFENSTAKNPYQRRLDDYAGEYIPKIRRIDFKIKRKPTIHSELLFKHEFKTFKKRPNTYEDDPIVFKSMNVDKDTLPYYNGVLWRRGMNKFQRSQIKEKK